MGQIFNLIITIVYQKCGRLFKKNIEPAVIKLTTGKYKLEQKIWQHFMSVLIVGNI